MVIWLHPVETPANQRPMAVKTAAGKKNRRHGVLSFIAGTVV
jgi:hypothetical protein